MMMSNFDPSKLYTSRERKNITERLKSSKDLVWFSDLIKSSSSSQLLYLSEPMTECFKSKKLTLEAPLVHLIAQSLDKNCQNILKSDERSFSLEEITFFSICCQGLHLFFKSKISDTFDIGDLHTYPEQLMEFLQSSKYFPREALNLILPFVIFIYVKRYEFSPKDLHKTGKGAFSNNQYLLALWENCLLKACRFGESEADIILKILRYSVQKISNEVVWYQFVYLDTIKICMRKCVLLKEEISRIFDLATVYSDDHGLNVSKVCGEMLQICLEIDPELLQTVWDISLGPWYSRKTISFLNLYLSKCKLLDKSMVSTVLERLVSHLGYNRLDHCSLKAIQALLDRNLNKDNFSLLLEICVSSVDKNSAILRILSRCVQPLFNKPIILPEDQKGILIKILDSRESTDQGRMFLFEMFFTTFKQDLLPRLLSSQLNRSSSSEVQSTLIMLISRNVKDFVEGDFLVSTYANLLTLPCPTVRLHAIASFQSVPTLAKSHCSSLAALINLFLKNIYREAPYHSLVMSLNFFIILLKRVGVHCLTDVQITEINVQLTELLNHSDTEISSLAKKIKKHFLTEIKSNENSVGSGPDSFTKFMNEAGRVDSIQTVSQTDLPSTIPPLITHLSDLSTQEIVETVRKSVQLIHNLLNMISHNSSDDEQFYSAPSFEETFVIIQSAVEGDETFCKNTGKSVWSSIASLLELLRSCCGYLVDSTMEGFLMEGEMHVADLHSIGDVCLKCVFRCRHRSVINASCDTLKVISVRTFPHPPTHHLPSLWVKYLLNVLYSPTSSSLSRRSAGLPEAVEAVLQCNSLTLTRETVVKLLETAEIPYPEQCTETEDLVQVHSLHMLRVVLSSAKLRHHLIPFSKQICQLCYTGFVHSFWVVRNASFLLFAELVNYILGHLNTEFECGYRSNLSIGELKQQYRGIYDQVLSNLQEHSTSTQTCPTIFLSLMISSKLYPDTRDKDSILGEHIYSLLSSPIYKIRSVAARTVVLVTPRERLRELVKSSVEELGSVSHNKVGELGSVSHNKVNGVLLFLLECCKSDAELVGCDVIEDLTRRMRVENMLDINTSLLLQIYVTICRDKVVVSDIVIRKVLQIKEHCSSGGYPSNTLDYLGVWFLVSKDCRSVFAHIHSHWTQLSEIFWNNLDEEFYKNVDFTGLVWFLDALASQESHYVSDYLSNCVFEILNQGKIADLALPLYILEFLSDNIKKYAHICVLLSVSYNISTNASCLLQTLENNLRFDTSDTKLLSYLYKIQHCTHDPDLTASLLAGALLHCQSENEELRLLATRFCVSLATKENVTSRRENVTSRHVSVTARHAMECGVEYVRSLCDADERKLFITAIEEVKKKVLSEGERGFDIHSNAHFDKRLFLELLDF